MPRLSSLFSFLLKRGENCGLTFEFAQKYLQKKVETISRDARSLGRYIMYGQAMSRRNLAIASRKSLKAK